MPEKGKKRGKGTKRGRRVTLPDKPSSSPGIPKSSKKKDNNVDTMLPCDTYDEICCHASLEC